jgi:hypothetical protein
MGTRYFITVICPQCGHEELDVYYAPTCGLASYICTCGFEVDLEEVTGISYDEASNREEIEAAIMEVEK